MTKEIKLNNVRLSYPSLFKKKEWPTNNEKNPPKYEATFILDKQMHKQEIDKINSIIDACLNEIEMTRSKVRPDNICLKDGDINEQTEYKNAFYIKATCNDRPIIVNRDGKTPVYEEDNLIYGGCYVNAYLKFFAYDNVSKGVKATIGAMQYVNKGEAFGREPMDISKIFDPLDNEEGSATYDNDLPF